MPTGPSFIRPFQSVFCLISHEIPNTNLAIIGKFDYFNPNTKVSGDDIGVAGSHTGIGDIAWTTYSCGLSFSPTRNVRFSL